MASRNRVLRLAECLALPSAGLFPRLGDLRYQQVHPMIQRHTKCRA